MRNNQRGFGDRDRQMYTATCDQCGRRCEVPFMPSGEKPVYCNDCFSEKRADSPRPQRDFGSRGGDRRGDRGDRGDRGGRPSSGSGNEELIRHISTLASKMDRLIDMVGSMSSTKASAQPKSEEPKPAKAKKAAKEEVVAEVEVKEEKKKAAPKKKAAAKKK